MHVEYESPYHKLLAELVENEYLDGAAPKMFEVFLRAQNPLTRKELIRLVFDGTKDWEVDLSAQDKREMIRWGLDELWEHGIPILSLSGGYYVLGNNPDVVLSEIHSLEEKI
ncbi:MAG: hypothetical protein QM730_15820 [Anaerolineales bacterium]